MFDVCVLDINALQGVDPTVKSLTHAILRAETKKCHSSIFYSIFCGNPLTLCEIELHLNFWT